MYWTYLEKIIQVLIEETIRHFHFYNILKISILPKLCYKIQSNPNKNINRTYMKIDNLILKFLWKRKYTKIVNDILGGKSQEVGTYNIRHQNRL